MAKVDGRKRPVTALIPTVGQTGINQPLINLETGVVQPKQPPNATLSEMGKMRLLQLIVAGWDDAPIAELLVDEQHVLSYTAKAVNYWRNRPEVQVALSDRYRRALQVGWGSKDKRKEELETLAQAMRDELLVLNPRTGALGLRATYEDASGSQRDVSRQSQAMLIKEFREVVKQIGELVDDPPGHKVEVNHTGSIEHNHAAKSMGMASISREDLMARLRQATDVVDAEYEEVKMLPASLADAEKIPTGDSD